MARPQQVSDDQVIEAARRCFLEHGPSVSTDVIAAELGVSSQALFKRFGSKQELMLAAVRPPASPPWAAKLEAGPDDRPFREQLGEIIEELSTFFAEITRRMSMIRWSGVSPEELIREYDPPPPLIGIRALRNWLKRAHEKGLIRKADFEAVAVAILGALHAPGFLEDMLGRKATRHSRSTFVREVVDVFAQGLNPDQDD